MGDQQSDLPATCEEAVQGLTDDEIDAIERGDVVTQIAVCSFPEFKPEYGVPVRIANGYPRYKLRYPLPREQVIKELAPEWATMKWPRPKFTAAYREKLDALGLDEVRRLIRRHVPAHRRPVLLCFEQMGKKPGTWCHRTILQQWLIDQGCDVVELGVEEQPAPQQTLSL